MKRPNPKAQTILEYVIIIMAIVAALSTAGLYYKRSLQGKYRQTGDLFGGGEQYTPK